MVIQKNRPTGLMETHKPAPAEQNIRSLGSFPIRTLKDPEIVADGE